MTKMTGWCMDERQALEDLDDPQKAAHYHNLCPNSEDCPCTRHKA